MNQRNDMVSQFSYIATQLVYEYCINEKCLLENLIGKGGYSEVYKGCLANEECVAIKRLNKGVPEEDVFNFLSEIGIIAHLNHPNTARMIGYGVDGGAFLVLQLSPLGSLGAMLHSNTLSINTILKAY